MLRAAVSDRDWIARAGTSRSHVMIVLAHRRVEADYPAEAMIDNDIHHGHASS